jgi:hypothetical protein
MVYTAASRGSTPADPRSSPALPMRSCGLLLLGLLCPVSHAASQPPDSARRDSVRRDSAVTRRQDTTRATPLPSVEVRARRRMSEYDRRLERARSLGGRVVSRESIAKAAPTSRNLGDLMRRTAAAMVQVVSGYGSSNCLLVQRNVNLQQRQSCALFIVDDVVSMGDPFIAPGDVDLIVVIPASAAMVHFGERARYGAVAIYTKAGSEDPPPG